MTGCFVITIFRRSKVPPKSRTSPKVNDLFLCPLLTFPETFFKIHSDFRYFAIKQTNVSCPITFLGRGNKMRTVIQINLHPEMTWPKLFTVQFIIKQNGLPVLGHLAPILADTQSAGSWSEWLQRTRSFLGLDQCFPKGLFPVQATICSWK